MIKLRPYQKDTLDSIAARMWGGRNRLLTKLPTGCGKTIVFSAMPDYFGYKNRMMVLVHREELADQTAKKLRLLNPNRSVGVEMADQSCNNADLVVGSVPTLGGKNSKRIQQFNANDFDAIIIDEAHHSVGGSYQNVIEHFQVYETAKRLLNGTTATPNRADGKGMNEIYQEICYDYSMLQAIKDGWLADIRGIRIFSKTSLDDIKRVAGDLNLGQLGHAVNNPVRNDMVVRGWLDHGENRQTIVFAVDIEHARSLTAAFKGYGIVSEAIWGDDPFRKEKLAGHRAGQIKVLVNCQILTEGYDDWRIGCIILARPTESEGLYTQMIGRGTRIPEDVENLLTARAAGQVIAKSDCILIDVVDLSSKHSLVSLPSLIGLPEKLDMKGRGALAVVAEYEEIHAAKPLVDLSAATDANSLSTYAESVDLFQVKFSPEIEQNSQLSWFKTSTDHYFLKLPNKEYICIDRDVLDNWNIHGTILTRQLDSVKTTFKDAITAADGAVKEFGGGLFYLLRRVSKKDGEAVTAPQREMCRRYRITIPANATKGDVRRKLSQVLSEAKAAAQKRIDDRKRAA